MGGCTPPRLVDLRPMSERHRFQLTARRAVDFQRVASALCQGLTDSVNQSRQKDNSCATLYCWPS
uniref:putative leader peptide n=1 Tax=Tessaracoccus bendigoensis TaxID=72764 RepID=UPI003CCB7D07